MSVTNVVTEAQTKPLAAEPLCSLSRAAITLSCIFHIRNMLFPVPKDHVAIYRTHWHPRASHVPLAVAQMSGIAGISNKTEALKNSSFFAKERDIFNSDWTWLKIRVWHQGAEKEYKRHHS